MSNRKLDISNLALHSRIEILEDHADSMNQWRKSVDENTQIQKEVVAVGKDIISAIRVLGWIGKFLKFLAYIAAGISFIIATIKGVHHL